MNKAQPPSPRERENSQVSKDRGNQSYSMVKAMPETPRCRNLRQKVSGEARL